MLYVATVVVKKTFLATIQPVIPRYLKPKHYGMVALHFAVYNTCTIASSWYCKIIATLASKRRTMVASTIVKLDHK